MADVSSASTSQSNSQQQQQQQQQPSVSSSVPKPRRGRGGRFYHRKPREGSSNVNHLQKESNESSNNNFRGSTKKYSSTPQFAFNPNAAAFIPTPSLACAQPSTDPNNAQKTTGSNQRRVNNRNPRGNRRGRGANHNANDNRRNLVNKVDDRSLRERLIYQLENNRYECAICYQKVTTKQGIWSCKTCYHIFHISNNCIVNWAKSSRDGEEDNKWRCPTCQTKTDVMPYNYFCFCGKQRNPTYQIGETPHSCGEVCGGSRKFDCPHPCTEYCHPGPCADCQQQHTKPCNCGKTQKSVKCGTGAVVQCDLVCEKLLNCGVHKCQQICHQGECEPCSVVVKQDCFCGSKNQEIYCSPQSSQKFSCGLKCENFYDCGVHKCAKKCHDTSKGCGECETDVTKIRNCPCGKKTLNELGVVRNKCDDPIPTCESVCNRMLECGSMGNVHRCQAKCHVGPCPPCKLTSFTICRCGAVKTHLPCEEYLKIMKKTGELICEKKCKKKKSCLLHRCQEKCCIQEEHFCLQICNKKLSCGLHNCEHVCHAGKCPKCLEASFDEVYCHCGKTVTLPPIPCGKGLPVCKEVCSRRTECGHDPGHRCHPDSVSCPPCLEYVTRKCHCGLQTRRVACFITDISCGTKCGKPLSCGQHVCNRKCHGEECEKPGEKCTKKCEKLRIGCEHACLAECHGDSECPPSICRQLIKVTCECGRIKKEIVCAEYDRLLKEDEKEESESDEPAKLKRSSSMTQLNRLSCDDVCKKLERNRRIADALNIEIDENGETKLAPMITFPVYLKEVVRTNIDFVRTVEKVFLDMLEQLKDPTKEQNMMRAHLPPMSLEKRRFIHEYATYFKIETESVDSPPKRSILLMAMRGKSHQPLVLISDLLKYKGALNTPGPSVIRKDAIEEEMQRKIKCGEEGEGMKQLKTKERVVYKREPNIFKKLESAKPIKQSNMFELLGSENEDEEEKDEEGGRENEDESSNAECSDSQNQAPMKDWWKEDDQVASGEEVGEWKEVKVKEWVVLEEVEEVEGETWEDE